MRRRFIAWYPLGLLLALTALTFWLERTVRLAAPDQQKRERSDPDFIIEGLSAVESGPAGRPRNILVATKLTHYPDDDSSHLTEPRLSRIEAGDPGLYVRSDRAVVSSNGTDIYFMGEVRAVQANPPPGGPLSLSTNFLHVVPDKDYAETREPVTVTDARTTITAVGLELNAQTRILKLLSQVNGQYLPSRK
jgi:lipopolysaccharide export system protein LptC